MTEIEIAVRVLGFLVGIGIAELMLRAFGFRR